MASAVPAAGEVPGCAPDALVGLRLEGTIESGGVWLAIISGGIYKTGEPLAGGYAIASIGHALVVLEGCGEPLRMGMR